jgi:hypothetical protein
MSFITEKIPPTDGFARLACAVCPCDMFLVNVNVDHPEIVEAVCVNCGARNALIVKKGV